MKFRRLLLAGACVSSFLAPTSSQAIRFEQRTDPETASHPIPRGTQMSLGLGGYELQGVNAISHAGDPTHGVEFDWEPIDGHVILENGNGAGQIPSAFIEQLQAWLGQPPHIAGAVRALKIAVGTPGRELNDHSRERWFTEVFLLRDQVQEVLENLTPVPVSYLWYPL